MRISIEEKVATLALLLTVVRSMAPASHREILPRVPFGRPSLWPWLRCLEGMGLVKSAGGLWSPTVAGSDPRAALLAIGRMAPAVAIHATGVRPIAEHNRRGELRVGPRALDRAAEEIQRILARAGYGRSGAGPGTLGG